MRVALRPALHETEGKRLKGTILAEASGDFLYPAPPLSQSHCCPSREADMPLSFVGADARSHRAPAAELRLTLRRQQAGSTQLPDRAEPNGQAGIFLFRIECVSSVRVALVPETTSCSRALTVHLLQSRRPGVCREQASLWRRLKAGRFYDDRPSATA